MIFREPARMRVWYKDREVDVLAYSATDAKLQAITAMELDIDAWGWLKVGVRKEDIELAGG